MSSTHTSKNGAIIIATGPHGFAGAGEAMRRWLIELKKSSFEVTLVSKSPPYRKDDLSSIGIVLENVQSVSSGAIGETGAAGSIDSLSNVGLSQKIIECARAANDSGRKIIIWAHYLFPFALAAHTAVKTLRSEGIQCRFWVTPTGSDIWEVSPLVPDVANYILGDATDRVIVYSERFAREVLDLTDSCGDKIDIVSPIIDCDRFQPAQGDERALTRAQFGIPEESFLICHHSNMRPVKRPERVIAFARDIADQVKRAQTHLLMIGPVRPDLQSTNEGLFVHWLGVQDKVETFLKSSDLAVNLSAHDSFNLSLGEAMASGVPVVSSDIVGIAPIIRKHSGGWVFQFEPDKTGRADYRLIVDTIARWRVSGSPSIDARSLAASVKGELGGECAGRALKHMAQKDLNEQR
ncbi:MAG: glycosyltransferase [Henriciella sp.]